MSGLKRLLREPLVQFLLLGAAVFLLDAWLRPSAGPAASTEIVVGEARIRNLAQNFQRTWQRPPTRLELDGLIESHIREEVYYREALALGLDRDDPIIRRRLQQKVEFVSEEAAALSPPTDAELAGYLKAHADAFAVEARATFLQVYLDPARRTATLAADARRLLERLNGAGGAPGPAKLGDTLLLIEPRYENATRTEIERLFGAEFAATLVKQPVGTWAGPIPSGFGVHLVKVEAIEHGGVPSLDAVRPLVEREWMNAKRSELSRAFYDRLRARYTITVRVPGAAKP